MTLEKTSGAMRAGDDSRPDNIGRFFRIAKRRSAMRLVLAASVVALTSVAYAATVGDAARIRSQIDRQVGGLRKLVVPVDDSWIPLPRSSDGTVNPRYKMTEAKRYLGKMLFHDPIRTARIDPAFGGIAATSQTASCGSCHLGEAAGKAGAVLNFAVGGEGRGYTDKNGNYVVRRRARSDLPLQRTQPLFAGDALVDALPTLTDIYRVPPAPGALEVATPARGRRSPEPLRLVATGRLDPVDSVGRQSPGMIGFAFNNRLLFGGFAGEPDTERGALNPFSDPAQENLTLLLLDAHRMLGAQSAELQKIPAFVKLFRDAFPEEAAQADAKRDMNLLINDETVLRATATFLRTVVTRDTPFDRFLSGRNDALTDRQLRGAQLFFTPAKEGGAGCFSCHSGPMLNKQPNDPDIVGTGALVEENFINIGIGDHPLQALNRLARNDPNFHDTGREEITGKPEHLFKFRSLTLRQLKEARTFFHNGSFTDIRAVVEYFNAGVPQDAAAGAAATLDERFTHPRGPGSSRGLGLSKHDVDALTDFLENGLYDPAFSKYDPKSPTPFFQPSPKDLAYSVYRPDLAALGAKDGFVLSGLATDNNDALSRRDLGLEFLDVTAQLQMTKAASKVGADGQRTDTYTITNKSGAIVDTHLLLIVRNLTAGARLTNASGTTRKGEPYIRIFLPKDGILAPGDSIAQDLAFTAPSAQASTPYTIVAMSGQGKP